MMFDIDWQGTRQIGEKMRADVVSVFVLPPSMAELKARLERRAEDTPEVIERRLTNAREEIAQWGSYDYVLDQRRSRAERSSQLKAILVAERLKRERQVGLDRFVNDLLGAHSFAGGRGPAPLRPVKALARATKPATGTSSARAVSASPAAAISGPGSAARDFRLCRSILRR